MPARPRQANQNKTEVELSQSYDSFKEFEGKKYTGMKVGRSHSWYYDKGEWKETKITPDEWRFTYDVVKRRKGHAPEGSGVPVGTEYHWYILAHQTVKKLNANDYTTSMSGMKYKLAHKRAGSEKWSATDKAQKRQLIKVLQDSINKLQEDLESQEPPGAEVQEGPESSPVASRPKLEKQVTVQSR
jgi:hypothetical protein